MNDILDNISGIFGPEIDKKELELLFYLDQKVPINLIGDQLRLSQILINLIGNAIKFTTQGEIILSINLKSTTYNLYELEFSVQDTGIGIKKED